MPATTLHQPYTLSLSSLCIGIPLGLCIGAVNALIIQRLLHTFFGFLPGDILSSFVAVFVSGIIAGAIQGAFLRPFTRPVVIWLVASGMGWSVAYGLMRYFYATTATATILPTIAEVSLGLGMGLLVGIAQCVLVDCKYRAVLGHALGRNDVLLLRTHGSSAIKRDNCSHGHYAVMLARAAAQQGAGADAAARPQDRRHFEKQDQLDCVPDLSVRRGSAPGRWAHTITQIST